MTKFFLWLGIAILVFVLGILLLDDWRSSQGRRLRARGRVVSHRISHDDGAVYHIPEVSMMTPRASRTGLKTVSALFLRNLRLVQR